MRDGKFKIEEFILRSKIQIGYNILYLMNLMKFNLKRKMKNIEMNMNHK